VILFTQCLLFFIRRAIKVTQNMVYEKEDPSFSANVRFALALVVKWFLWSLNLQQVGFCNNGILILGKMLGDFHMLASGKWMPLWVQQVWTACSTVVLFLVLQLCQNYWDKRMFCLTDFMLSECRSTTPLELLHWHINHSSSPQPQYSHIMKQKSTLGCAIWRGTFCSSWAHLQQPL